MANNYDATGDGSKSVYVLAMKLLQLKQDGHPGAFARYVKTFPEFVRELKAKKTDEKGIFDLFIRKKKICPDRFLVCRDRFYKCFE
jgi:hypothetical protein